MTPSTVGGYPTLPIREALAVYAEAFRAATGLEHDLCFPGVAVATIRRFATRVRADVLVEALHELAATGEEPSIGNLGRSAARLAVIARRAAPIEPEWIQQARVWVEEHDRPTGIRFARGDGGGHYVRDVLGFDKLPQGYIGGPTQINPDLWEIAHALKERELRQNFKPVEVRA